LPLTSFDHQRHAKQTKAAALGMQPKRGRGTHERFSLTLSRLRRAVGSLGCSSAAAQKGSVAAIPAISPRASASPLVNGLNRPSRILVSTQAGRYGNRALDYESSFATSPERAVRLISSWGWELVDALRGERRLSEQALRVHDGVLGQPAMIYANFARNRAPSSPGPSRHGADLGPPSTRSATARPSAFGRGRPRHSGDPPTFWAATGRAPNMPRRTQGDGSARRAATLLDDSCRWHARSSWSSLPGRDSSNCATGEHQAFITSRRPARHIWCPWLVTAQKLRDHRNVAAADEADGLAVADLSKAGQVRHHAGRAPATKEPCSLGEVGIRSSPCCRARRQ